MLYNYFIFLCLSVYASCGREFTQRTSIRQIQIEFCKNEQQLLDHLIKAEQIPQYIPDNFTKRCAKFHLNTFNKLLNQSVPKELVAPHFHDRLKKLTERWPKQHGDDTKCQYTLESIQNLHSKLIRFLLEALPTFVGCKPTTCPPENTC